MPSEQILTHTHRYSSYLLGLRENWSYAGTSRDPGRTKEEKEDSRRVMDLHKSKNVKQKLGRQAPDSARTVTAVT